MRSTCLSAVTQKKKRRYGTGLMLVSFANGKTTIVFLRIGGGQNPQTNPKKKKRVLLPLRRPDVLMDDRFDRVVSVSAFLNQPGNVLSLVSN